MKEEKLRKELTTVGIILCVLQGLNLLLNLTSANAVGIIVSVVMLSLIITFWILTSKANLAGPIIGIIIGALNILTLNIFSIIIGICVIIDCSRFIKSIK